MSSLTGGSINRVYLLHTSEAEKVIKLNHANKFPGMFPAEMEGLKALKETKTFDVPEVYSCGEISEQAYLLLEYKKESPQKSDFWKQFAEDLSAMHKVSATEFGFGASK